VPCSARRWAAEMSCTIHSSGTVLAKHEVVWVVVSHTTSPRCFRKSKRRFPNPAQQALKPCLNDISSIFTRCIFDREVSCRVPLYILVMVIVHASRTHTLPAELIQTSRSPSPRQKTVVSATTRGNPCSSRDSILCFLRTVMRGNAESDVPTWSIRMYSGVQA